MPVPAGYTLDKPKESKSPTPKLPAGYTLDAAPPEVETAAASTPALPPNPTSIPTPPPPEGFLHSLAAPFVSAAKGVKSAVYEGPQNPTEAKIEQQFALSPGVGRTVLAIKRMLVDPQVEQGRQAIDEFHQASVATPWTSFSPSPVAQTHRQLAAGHAIAALLPGLGPWAASVGQREGEQLGTGDYSGAAGTAFGNALLALAPKAVGKVVSAGPEALARGLTGTGAAPVRDLVAKVRDLDVAHRSELLRLRQQYEQQVRDANEAARTGTEADRAKVAEKNLAAKQAYEQAVRDQQAKYQADRTKATEANAEAQRKFNQKIGETARTNRESTAAEAAARDRSARLQVGGSQLIYGLNQLDRALRDRAGAMYDAIRAKVGGISIPGTDLGAAARDAMTNIKGTSVTPTVFRDILGKYPEAEPESIEYQGTQIPKGHPLYDVLKQQGAVDTAPVTFADLQGYYSELGKELSKGTLAGDVYLATRDLQDAVGNLMQRITKQAGPGVNDQFISARKFYREYMDTFHEPTGPSSSGSPVAQALLAKDPLVAVDKFAGDSGDRGVALLRRYSDSLANLAQDVRQRAQAKVTVPARKSVADIPAPKSTPVPGGPSLPLPPVLETAPPPRAPSLPLPPTLPDAPRISAGDIAAVRRAALDASAGKWWNRGRWAAAAPIIWALRGFFGGHIPNLGRAAIESGGVLSATRAATGIMRYPPLVRFLTEARPEDLALVPPELRGDLAGLVSQAKGAGIRVSPALASAAVAGAARSTAPPVPQPESPTTPSPALGGLQ